MKEKEYVFYKQLQITDEISQISQFDRLFLEFGKAKPAAITIHESGQNISIHGYNFEEPAEARSKMVVRTNVRFMISLKH